MRRARSRATGGDPACGNVAGRIQQAAYQRAGLIGSSGQWRRGRPSLERCRSTPPHRPATADRRPPVRRSIRPESAAPETVYRRTGLYGYGVERTEASESGDASLWTIGHATLPFDRYVELLREHDIELVIDVRSRPFFRWAEHYNRAELEPALRERQIEYAWRGELLGQRPHGDHFYDSEGHTLYDELVKQKWFMKAVGELEYEAGRRRTALTCLEEEPWRCHRYLLLGRVLVQRGNEVLHIRKDGRVQTQQDVATVRGEGQGALFGEREEVWRSPMPMRGGHGRRESPDDPWE